MKQDELRQYLKDLHLGGLRAFESIGSTNDEALAWAADDARDLSLVISDEQTSGRGRQGRVWYSQPEASLTFSLILKPQATSDAPVARFAFVGAVALVRALKKLMNVQAEIKWPNDVLIEGKKVCGILVEAVWTGATLDSVVLGMGVNLLTSAFPSELPINFPAASLQHFHPSPPSRQQLLKAILSEIIVLMPTFDSPAFIAEVRSTLALRGQEVKLLVNDGEPAARVRIEDVRSDGSLLVSDLGAGGRLLTLHQGEVHLLSE